jgi:hypothetical protein
MSQTIRELYKAQGEVATRIREGRASAEDHAAYDALEAQIQALRAQEPREPVRSIFDLPITRRMWEADAQDVERYED